jgi:hypothetical protein
MNKAILRASPVRNYALDLAAGWRLAAGFSWQRFHSPLPQDNCWLCASINLQEK